MFRQKNGIHFENLCIDPHKSPKEENVLLTHAHSDHVKLNNNSNFFGTTATIDLIKERYPRKTNPNFISLEFDKETKLEDFSFTLKPNGHILGSSQVLIKNDFDYALTSDFRLQDSVLFKGAIPLHADTIVLETTFGSPAYVFPNQNEVVDEMISWIKKEAKNKLVLLVGYSLGKTQELTKIANLAGFVPVVHESIFRMNEIYKKHGIKLGEYELLDHNLKDFSVLIMPPSLVDRFLIATLKEVEKRKIVSALASGWSYVRGFDKLFPLSNHADYNDLIKYVKEANPKLVLTDHGYCEEFARKLNRLGFNAKPLKQNKQQVLFDF